MKLSLLGLVSILIWKIPKIKYSIAIWTLDSNYGL